MSFWQNIVDLYSSAKSRRRCSRCRANSSRGTPFHRRLPVTGWHIRVLCDRDRTALVLVYHPAMLAQEQPRDTLRGLAYPGGDLDALLDHLQTRICGSASFPHEIGFFLGYPQEDVLGFIRHRGRHCKHCGLWKVYGDVSHAKTLFEEYRQCRHQLVRHVMNGGSLHVLPVFHQHAG